MAYSLPWLSPDSLGFPDPRTALREPNGLLAAGGDLSPERLLIAYSMGIFPWFNEGEPILWWSPDPRTVLFPGEVHISRSLAKLLKKQPFSFTCNHCFAEVIEACAQPRAGQPGTWITDTMKSAYLSLHQLGHAHSLECWRDGQLVGGIYGVLMNNCFFGESMFSRVDNASKALLVEVDRYYLQQQQFRLLDCQVSSAHLLSMGAVEIPRSRFIQLIQQTE
jgi:leucyl/phenylalanyl-tRNA--protein transferase